MEFYVGETAAGRPGIVAHAIACQNKECMKLTLQIVLRKWTRSPSGNTTWGAQLEDWSLLPESNAKPQPACVPDFLQQDYYEACRIAALSPKASATLARRCLQGMIRDFCKIADRTLDAEIKALQKLVDDGNAPRGVTHESVEAIDHVRRIGNIGAHMEQDVSLLIEIDPDEASILLELVETLFQDWYVARFDREQRLTKVATIRKEKDAQKSAPGKPATAA
jgi:hypothetical protein